MIDSENDFENVSCKIMLIKMALFCLKKNVEERLSPMQLLDFLQYGDVVKNATEMNEFKKN